MLLLRLYEVFVLLFPFMISWNSIASSQKLWKRQALKFCPNTRWVRYNGLCFLKVPREATYNEAKKRCRNKFVGSHLTKIRSKEDLNFLIYRFQNPYWIGLRQKSGTRWSGELIWEDGSSATFVNFSAGEPTNNPNEDCISLHEGGGYSDNYCNLKFWSACSIPPSVDFCETNNVNCHENARCYSTYLTFVCLCNDGFAGDGISSCTKSYGCPNSEWKEHKGLCYIENTINASYDDARGNCKSKYSGSSLAKIRIDGDRYFLLKSFKFSGYRWLGLRRTTTWRDALMWDDQSIVTFKYYEITEPDNVGGNQHCIITNNKGEWLDDFCDTHHGSFCSISASQVEITTTVTKITVEGTTPVSTVETGPIIAAIVGLIILLLGACIGYKKFKVRRSRPKTQSGFSKLKSGEHEDLYSSDIEEN